MVPMITELWSPLSQSKEISSDLCCFCGGGISHNEDALFSNVYCCLILNYPTPIEISIWKLVVRALVVVDLLAILTAHPVTARGTMLGTDH